VLVLYGLCKPIKYWLLQDQFLFPVSIFCGNQCDFFGEILLVIHLLRQLHACNGRPTSDCREHTLLSDVARGVDAGCGTTTSPSTNISVLLVTELIRLTLKKLQAALEDNRINDDDLVAMAMAVDAGAVYAALRATRRTEGTGLETSPPLPTKLQTSDLAISGSSLPISFSDLPAAMSTGDLDQPDTITTCDLREMAVVAKKVLRGAIDNIIEQ